MRRLILLLLALCALVGCGPRTTASSEAGGSVPTPTVPSAVTTTTEEPAATSAPTASPEPTQIPWRPRRPTGVCEPTGTRTCTILFVIAQRDFSSLGYSSKRRAFAQAGYTVVVASKSTETASACLDALEVQPDLALADVQVQDYDAVVFIGGRGCKAYWDDGEAHRIAQEAVERGKVVGATCMSPVILANAGVLEGRQAVANYRREGSLCDMLEPAGAICADAILVRDGPIITARLQTPQFVWGIIETVEEQGP